MIIKANRHSDGAKLASYLMDGGKHGERVELPELRGFDEAENIFDAFRDIEILADATKAENPFFHVQIRLPEGEQITREQWQETADRTQTRLGLDGQPRAAVYHIDEKTGEQHLHLVFSLIDAETLKAKPVPFFKMRLKALARELEEEFDITRVKNEREGPIKYAATKNEQQQAQRLGLDKDALRNTIRACWDRSDCGRSFDDELAQEGFILAQGEGRSGYIVIDHKGGVHALGKKLLGVTVAQVREKLSDLDRENMPTIAQAREFMLDLPRDRAERLTRELAETQKQLETERDYAPSPLSKDEQRVVNDLCARFENNLESYHSELPFIYEFDERIAQEIERRMLDTLQREIDAVFPELDPLSGYFEPTHGQQNQSPAAHAPPGIAAEIEKLRDAKAERDYARRDPVHEDMAWEDALAKAAIEKEKAEPQFIAAEDRKKHGAGQQQQKEPPPQARAPELGKTQGEIRLAFSLTQTAQEASNALEDRGFIVANITAADIAKDLEKLREEWEKRRLNPQSWMEHTGGYKELKPDFQDSARRSYDEWQAARQKRDPNLPDLDPEQEEKALHSYVEYVQRKWAEGPSSQLERAIGGLAAVTPFGSVYTFTPRNTGVERDELAEYLKGIDRTPLLSVSDAQDVMREVQDERRTERQMKRPLGKTDGEIRLAYSLTQTGQEFADALEDRGYILSIASPADVAMHDRHASWRAKERIERLEAYGIDPAKHKDEPDIPLAVGDFLVVDQYGNYHRLTDRNTGQPVDEREARLKDVDRAALPSVIDARAMMRDYRQHQQRERDEQHRAEWLLKQPLNKTDGEIRLASSLTQTGQEFVNALEDRGYIPAIANSADVAMHDRHASWRAKERIERLEAYGIDPATQKQQPETPLSIGELIVVDQYGNYHRLTDRNTGQPVDEREARLKDIDRAALPSVIDARAMMQDYQQHRRDEFKQKGVQWRDHQEQLKDYAARHPEVIEFGLDEERIAHHARGRDALAIYTSFEDSNRPKAFSTDGFRAKAFMAALEEHGIILARVDKNEAAQSHRKATFAREVGNYAPSYREGELVAVTMQGTVHKLDERTTGLGADQLQKYLAKLESFEFDGLEKTKAAMVEYGQQRREEIAANRLDQARNPRDYVTGATTRAGIISALRGLNDGALGASDVAGKVVSRTVSKAFDLVASTVFSVFSFFFPEAPKTREQIAAIRDENRRSEHAADIQAERERIDRKRRGIDEHERER